MELADSNTLQNLKDAFAGESQANRRYLYFAAKADVEGENDVAAVFRSTAEGETGHAHGHLDYMQGVGDPATGLPIGNTSANLKAAIAGETHEYTDMYPGMAKTARDEGFDEIADWFETLAKAERSLARQTLPEGPRRDGLSRSFAWNHKGPRQEALCFHPLALECRRRRPSKKAALRRPNASRSTGAVRTSTTPKPSKPN